MVGKKVLFRKSKYDDIGQYSGEDQLEGTILDKYLSVFDIENNVHNHDYYLVEQQDGTIVSIKPYDVIKILLPSNQK